MAVEIQVTNEAAVIKIGDEQINGQNFIFDDVMVHFDQNKEDFEKVIVDFSKVEYVNSLGIAEMISMIKYFREKNKKIKFKMINVNKKVVKLFKMVELGTLADIEPL